nr:alkaline phosphatase family protein [Deltaproteobacteria bacterium]
WYRRSEKREREAEYDADAPVFAVGPAHAGILAVDDNGSAKAMRVAGLADALRTATGGKARSVAISLKARGAVFVAGKQPDLAIWYEPAAGGMTTSRAYAPEAPGWLVELASTRSASRFYRSTWNPLDANLLAKTTQIADAAPGEGAFHGLDAAFPHDLAATEAPTRAIIHTTFGDDIVFDAVYGALDNMDLGKDATPDLLAISFGAHDYAGHLWGPDSWEVLDLTMRLDLALGKLFTTLDERVGAGQWAAVLTSDHGATPIVDRGKPGGRRIPTAEIAKAIDGALAPYGTGPFFLKFSSSNVYLGPAFDMVTHRDAALRAAADALATLPNIAAAAPSAKLAGNCEARRGLEQAMCFAIVDGEAGELFVVPVAGSLISDYMSGTHHDAPFDDNRRVPILVLAPGVAPGDRSAHGTLLQVAPTVAALLRIPPPPAANAPALFGLR